MSSNNFFKGGEVLKSNELKKELELKISEIKTLKKVSFLVKRKKILFLIIEYSTKFKKLNDLIF